MLQLASRIGLGMDIGNFLKLQGAFQRHRILRAAAKEQRVLLLDKVSRQFLNAVIELQHLFDQARQLP